MRFILLFMRKIASIAFWITLGMFISEVNHGLYVGIEDTSSLFVATVSYIAISLLLSIFPKRRRKRTSYN